MISWVQTFFTETYGKNGQLSKRVTHPLLIFVAVVLLQILFERYIFVCPDHAWKRFAYMAFFAPAVPLFFAGWLTNVDLQNTIRGLCFRCWNKEQRKRTILRIRWCYVIKTIFASHLTAYVAPFSWFLMCLLNQDIMTCGVFGPPPINATGPIKKKYRILGTQSQLIGFIMLLIATVVLAFMVTIKQCCKDVNSGKDIAELQCLDNYASYEADAARKHFEEMMRAAAEENGRRKVQMLLQAHNQNNDNLKGIERDMAKMSYEHLASVRCSLMQIYPKIDNHYDRKIQLYTIEKWEEEARVFQKQLKNDSGDALAKVTHDERIGHGHEMVQMEKDGEQINLLEGDQKKYTA